MFKFFFKKNFADGWDNLFFILLSNVIPIALAVGSYFAVAFMLAGNPLFGAITLMLCAGIFFIFVFAWGANARKIADFNSPSFGLWFRSIAAVWKTGFLFGFLFAAFVLACRIGIIYYYKLYLSGNILGLVLAAMIGWFFFSSLMAIQWFIPFYFLQEENSFFKCLKKSFIIFFDNPSFSFGMLVYNAFLLALSCLLIFFIPGVNGITLSCTNALRIRIYKYDWIEKMSEGDPSFANDRDRRNEVPWDELIAEDKEALGQRNLSSFLFPWK